MTDDRAGHPLWRNPVAGIRSDRRLMDKDLRQRVLLRDRECFLFKLDLSHVCRDQWGRIHSPAQLDKLTVDHVKDGPMMGRKAPDDEWHLVAMCWAGNVGGPSREERQAERSYLGLLRDTERPAGAPDGPEGHRDPRGRPRGSVGLGSKREG